MKVYLSVPMIANSNPQRARVMAKAIEEAGHEVSSPWVLGPPERHDPSVLNIFSRDKSGVENSDAIVADVSVPSIGVGMELMAAHREGKRVIVVMRQGSTVSSMLMHMDPKEVVEFKDESDLYPRLRRVLETS